MNKIAIISGIVGLVAGATGGYLACHFIEKKNVDAEISKGIQQGLDEIRGSQKQKAMENEAKKAEMIKFTGRDIHAIDGIKLVKSIAEDNGYLPENKKTDDVKEPDDEPDSDLPFEEGMVEKSIWDEDYPYPGDPDELSQEEHDALQEPEESEFIKGLDPTKPPYKILKDQYNEELQTETEQGFWDKLTLIFFTDNVFAERVRYNEYQTMSSEQIEKAIGKNNMRDFIEDRSLEKLYVRNNRLHIDYEIVRSSRSYSSAMGELDEE